MPLEGVCADEWVVFDQVLIVRDLFTGGNRSFTNSADAREFRAAVYKQYGEFCVGPGTQGEGEGREGRGGGRGGGTEGTPGCCHCSQASK